MYGTTASRLHWVALVLAEQRHSRAAAGAAVQAAKDLPRLTETLSLAAQLAWALNAK